MPRSRAARPGGFHPVPQQPASTYRCQIPASSVIVVPVVITIYADKSYDFVLKTSPAAEQIKKYAKIKKGSSKGANEVVATITQADLKAIAENKLPDLNAYTVEEAMKIIEGTARNMGVAVQGLNDKELAAQAEEAKREELEAQKREAKLEALEEENKATNAEVEVITEKSEESDTESETETESE